MGDNVERMLRKHVEEHTKQRARLMDELLMAQIKDFPQDSWGDAILEYRPGDIGMPVMRFRAKPRWFEFSERRRRNAQRRQLVSAVAEFEADA